MRTLLWLLRTSFRNWLLQKIRRLKEPRYALSAAFLSLYMCALVGPMFALTGSTDVRDITIARASVQAFATGFVLLSFAWSWIVGAQGALAFSMAEATFLFPAPVSRRSLLVMKIVRTQLPVVISTLFFSFAKGSLAQSSRWPILCTNFLVFEAMFLNRLVAALAQCPRPATGEPHWTARAGRLVAIAVLVGIAVSFRPFNLATAEGGLLGVAAQWANREPAVWVLAPFRSFAGPVLARTPVELAHALVAPGGIVLGLLAVVLASKVPFEETALGQSELLKQRIDFIRRTGRLRSHGPVRPAPFSLPLDAGPVLALAWKNYLAISRLPLWRLGLYAALGMLTAWLLPRFEATRALVTPVAFVATWGAFMATLLGPDALRSDLRTSLRGADFLKTVPVPGWKIFLGEILAGPAVIISFQGAVLAGVALLAQSELPQLSPVTIACAWLALVIFLFPMDLLVFTIANGVAVAFPQWATLGPRPERGAEAIGQNLIVGIVRYLVLMGGLLPASAVSALVASVGWVFLGGPALPLGALAGGLVVLAEVALLVRWLGGMLERLDPSVELG